MQIERAQASDLVVTGLPDGSKVIVDSKSEQVYALNATAGAAWDACSSPTTLSNVADEMRHSMKSEVTDEVAEQAILQLEEKKLVTVSGSPKVSRRQSLAFLGAVALPIVVSMTLSDQRAFALQARSGVGDPGDDSSSCRPKPHVSHSTGPNY